MRDEIEIVPSSKLCEATARSAGELLVRVWPRPGVTVEARMRQLLEPGLGYQGPDDTAPRSVVVREHGKVVAHAALFPRTVLTQQGPLSVAGLAKVCVDPDLRGRRLGERVVRGAFEAVDSGHFPFALFQTARAVQSFYEHLGCCQVTNRFVNSLAVDPEANPWWDEVVMRYPASRTDWPSGVIDIHGPGF